MSKLIKNNPISVALRTNDVDNELREKLDYVAESFVEIGGLLSIIKDEKLYESYEYKDIYEYAEDRYSLSKTTVKNFIAIFKKFGYIDDIETLWIRLNDDYKDFNYSQLVELVSVPDDKLIEYNPSMTVKEIRSNKRLDKSINEFVKELKVIYNEINKIKDKLTCIKLNDKEIKFDEIDEDLINEYSCDLNINWNFGYLVNGKELRSSFDIKIYYDEDVIYKKIILRECMDNKYTTILDSTHYNLFDYCIEEVFLDIDNNLFLAIKKYLEFDLSFTKIVKEEKKEYIIYSLEELDKLKEKLNFYEYSYDKYKLWFNFLKKYSPSKSKVYFIYKNKLELYIEFLDNPFDLFNNKNKILVNLQYSMIEFKNLNNNQICHIDFYDILDKIYPIDIIQFILNKTSPMSD